VPPREVPANPIKPPGPPPEPPLAINVALLASLLSKKKVWPPELPRPDPPPLVMVALPAFDESWKFVTPPGSWLVLEPSLVKAVMLPAVAVPVKFSDAPPPTKVSKFCIIPEEFVMPLPLMVNTPKGSTLIVKAFVSEAVKSIAAISMLCSIRGDTEDKLSNVAVSVGEVPG